VATGGGLAEDVAAALARAEFGDPFAVLGPHQGADGRWTIRAMLPGARAVAAIDPTSERTLARLDPVGDSGVFAGIAARRRRPFAYRLRVDWHGTKVSQTLDDPYRFGPLASDVDLWLFAEGTLAQPDRLLGAHTTTIDGVEGTRFAVWAPNARRAAVVADCNGWDERRHPMRLRIEAGIWELFLPGVAPGTRYKFALVGPTGERLAWRADPYARETELRPATASVVSTQCWPLPTRGPTARVEAPIAIYEVHPASWRRKVAGRHRVLDWDELADTLPAYAEDMGFTHIELMPISEYPFDPSWGYQPTGLYAPSARFGAPAGLVRFVDRCHSLSLGVILDWVPGHFPADEHALARFDGTHLYEHADPREGLHPDWQTLIYNFGRREVSEFLLGSARAWIERYGVDGLRVDAVASMLYRDYSRKPGEWAPNVHGGRENLEAIAFLRRMNETLGRDYPDVLTVAEESTAWPGVSRPTSAGGLGFHYKWNMGWMNDTLRYMARDPAHRRYHQNELTFGLMYAFDEQFVLPLSHDEVVHGKGSLLGRMPGDRWQRFANLRLYLGFMYAHPGKKLVFMGGEFAQEREWDYANSLDWHLLDDPAHRGMQTLVRDLNRLYRDKPALHRQDCASAGFEWISHDDHANGILAFERIGDAINDRVIVVCNFTPVMRTGYRIGVRADGGWRECLNTDSRHYAGGNQGNGGARLTPDPVAAHSRPASLLLTLPPLALIFLEWTP
jgi:1,4-alpha-glucan branching enzyme